MPGPWAAQDLQMPAGLTMRANANGVGGGGTWVQLELTDALIYNKASVILLIWRAGACSSLCLESVKIHDNSKNCTCTFVQASKLKQGLIKNEYASLIITI